MTLDLQAFSRTGSWFAAPSANVNWTVIHGQGTEEDIDFELSGLTLTKTLKLGDEIELSKVEGQSASVGIPK